MAEIEIDARCALLHRIGERKGAQEFHALVDLVHHLAVARFQIGMMMIEIPCARAFQIRITAGRERAHQIGRRRRLKIGVKHALRIGNARGGREILAIDDVAAIGGQRDAAARFIIFGARLCELPRDAADLHHRHIGGECQHRRHAQENAERVADIVGGEFGEALRAVAALQQESLAFRHIAECGGEVPRLAREDERGMARQPLFHGSQSRRVRVFRHLTDGLCAPALRVPGQGSLLFRPRI